MLETHFSGVTSNQLSSVQGSEASTGVLVRGGQRSPGHRRRSSCVGLTRHLQLRQGCRAGRCVFFSEQSRVFAVKFGPKGLFSSKFLTHQNPLS